MLSAGASQCSQRLSSTESNPLADTGTGDVPLVVSMRQTSQEAGIYQGFIDGLYKRFLALSGAGVGLLSQ
jgi:hypothetical protein